MEGKYSEKRIAKPIGMEGLGGEDPW